MSTSTRPDHTNVDVDIGIDSTIAPVVCPTPPAQYLDMSPAPPAHTGMGAAPPALPGMSPAPSAHLDMSPALPMSAIPPTQHSGRSPTPTAHRSGMDPAHLTSPPSHQGTKMSQPLSFLRSWLTSLVPCIPILNGGIPQCLPMIKTSSSPHGRVPELLRVQMCSPSSSATVCID